MSIFTRKLFVADHGRDFAANAAIFLAFALPTLLNIHPRPLSFFVMETVLVSLLFLGLSLTYGRRLSLPDLLLPGTLLLLMGAAFQGGGAAVWVYVSYILIFLVAYFCGLVSEARIDRPLAYGLLACAFFQSIVVVMQVYAPGDTEWIPPLIGGRATGYIRQSNLLSDLLLLGLAALCHPAFDRLKAPCRLLASAWLGLAIAATGSRSAWLGIAVFCIIGFRCRVDGGRNAGSGLLTAAFAAAAGQFLFPLLHLFGGAGVAGSMARGGTQTSNEARVYLAQISWDAIKDSPWLGHGAGSFWRISVDALQNRPAREYTMLLEHAHNLPLNLAVEFGLPVSILVCAALLYWGYSRLRTLDPERGWALACVAVVFAHSMVEYPLWYTFLLVPCAFCMGIVDVGRPVRSGVRLPANTLRIAGLIGLLACLVTALDWMHVQLAWQQLVSSNEMTARVMSFSARSELEQVSRVSVFGQQVESLRLQSYVVSQDDLGLALRDCEAHWAERPTWFMLKSCGEVFAATGQEDSLRRLVNVQCKGYPAQHELLHDWAAAFDAGGKAKLKLVGRGCL